METLIFLFERRGPGACGNVTVDITWKFQLYTEKVVRNIKFQLFKGQIALSTENLNYRFWSYLFAGWHNPSFEQP